MLRVELYGARELSRDLLADKTRTPAFRAAVRESVNMTRRELRRRTPRRTGATARKIRGRVRRGRIFGWEGIVTFSGRGKTGRAHVARFLEYGVTHRAETLRARPGRFFLVPTPQGPRPVRAIARRGYSLPGRGFMRDTVDHVAPAVRDVLARGFSAPLELGDDPIAILRARARFRR